MKYALAALEPIAAALCAASRILVASDFDGTLCPIVSSPDSARLSPEMLNVLKAVDESPRLTLAVISGRALADVRGRLPLNVIFAGNHGLEIAGRGIGFEHAGAKRLRPAVAFACESLAEAVKPWPKGWVEDKGLTATLHYRQVPERDHAALLDAARRTAAEFGPALAIRPGKMVLEVRPSVCWDKGRALRLILEQAGPFDACLCLGDDQTDEAMFRANRMHINVRVGQASGSAAAYFLSQPEECTILLSRMVEELSSPAPSGALACVPGTAADIALESPDLK